MAYKIKFNKRFNANAEKVAIWLEKEWSKKVADEFARKLVSTVLSIGKNPFIGSSSHKSLAVRKFTTALKITRLHLSPFLIPGETLKKISTME